MFISATITSLVTTIDINPLTIAIFCTVFGCITMVMSQVVSLSQIYTVAKTKNTSGTSLLTYVFFVIMSLLSMSWAMTFYFNSGLPEGADIVLQQLRIVPLIICYFADLIYSLVMTAIKVRYMVLAKKMNKTELELSVYLINQQQKKYVESHYKKRYSKYFKFICLIFGASTLIILFGTLFSLYTADTIIKIGTSHPVDSDVVMTLSLLGAFA
ncbi:MAG: hypothetical protein MJ219_02525 [Mycoplasmoidaceae bacterium]|nr:hypothetical protein [Mycoplasmoidaceae bacterium]